jgi:hypothetical protein
LKVLNGSLDLEVSLSSIWKKILALLDDIFDSTEGILDSSQTQLHPPPNANAFNSLQIQSSQYNQQQNFPINQPRSTNSSQKFTSGIPNIQLPHVDDQFNQPSFNFPAQPQQQAPRAYQLV